MASSSTHAAPSSAEQAKRELQAMRHLVSSLSADNVAASAKAASSRKTADDLGRELSIAQSAAHEHAETVQKCNCDMLFMPAYCIFIYLFFFTYTVQ